MSQELRRNPGGKQPGLGTRVGCGIGEKENSKEPTEEASSMAASLLDCELILTHPTALFFWQRMDLKEQQTAFFFFLYNAKTHCP